MPIYLWKDKLTDYEIEIYRQNHEDYRVPPEDEELPKEEQGKKRDWQKLISAGIKTIKGDSWGPGKGYW